MFCLVFKKPALVDGKLVSVLGPFARTYDAFKYVEFRFSAPEYDDCDISIEAFDVVQPGELHRLGERLCDVQAYASNDPMFRFNTVECIIRRG